MIKVTEYINKRLFKITLFGKSYELILKTVEKYDEPINVK